MTGPSSPRTTRPTTRSMVALGLRLSVRGGREAAVRLVLTAVAIAIGVGLLLATLAATNAVGAQNDRYAWLETGAGAPPAAAAGVDPMWWEVTGDYFDGQLVGRVDVAATGTDSPAIPGIPAPPGPGEFYASPAMAKLLARTPSDQLADRWGGGRQIGVIGDDALPAPDSLVVVVGHEPSELSSSGHALQITAVNTEPPDQCPQCAPGIGINARGIALVLSVVVAALILPVLVFIGSATRLSAARREQRFAAMRLVGATPQQVTTVAVVESVVASALGVVGGFGLFLAIRPALATVAFTGSRFFLSDLSLSLADVLAVVIGVPVAAAVVARLALRRVTISPLGVTRHVTPKPPRAWRLVALVVGVAWMAYFLVAGRPQSTNGQVLAYLPGILTIMLGLVIAGPWLTMVGSRLMARRTGRPPVLIAGRRLADDPKAGFRAISGLILALFVGTVGVTVIATFVGERGGPPLGSQAAGVLTQDFETVRSADGPAPTVPAPLVAQLAAIPGVTGVAVAREAPEDVSGTKPAPDAPKPPPVDLSGRPAYVSCADLAKVPSLGSCPTGADVALVAIDTDEDRAGVVWPAAGVSASSLAGLAPSELMVGTDGSTSAIETARTTLEKAYPDTPRVAQTGREAQAQSNRELDQYQLLANVVIVISLVVAGCSLAVSVAGGLTDRRRPFSLLRLTGVPLGMLRRVVLVETVLPLLVGSVVAVGAGLVAAQIFVRSELQYNLHAPGAAYYVAVVVGIGGALALIASTFPLLRRITGPDVARNE